MSKNKECANKKCHFSRVKRGFELITLKGLCNDEQQCTVKDDEHVVKSS